MLSFTSTAFFGRQQKQQQDVVPRRPAFSPAPPSFSSSVSTAPSSTGPGTPRSTRSTGGLPSLKLKLSATSTTTTTTSTSSGEPGKATASSKKGRGRLVRSFLARLTPKKQRAPVTKDVISRPVERDEVEQPAHFFERPAAPLPATALSSSPSSPFSPSTGLLATFFADADGTDDDDDNESALVFSTTEDDNVWRAVASLRTVQHVQLEDDSRSIASSIPPSLFDDADDDREDPFEFDDANSDAEDPFELELIEQADDSRRSFSNVMADLDAEIFQHLQAVGATPLSAPSVARPRPASHAAPTSTLALTLSSIDELDEDVSDVIHRFPVPPIAASTAPLRLTTVLRSTAPLCVKIKRSTGTCAASPLAQRVLKQNLHQACFESL